MSKNTWFSEFIVMLMKTFFHTDLVEGYPVLLLHY